MEFKYKVGDTVRLNWSIAWDAGLKCQYVLITALHDDYELPAYSVYANVVNAIEPNWRPKFYERSIEGKKR